MAIAEPDFAKLFVDSGVDTRVEVAGEIPCSRGTVTHSFCDGVTVESEIAFQPGTLSISLVHDAHITDPYQRGTAGWAHPTGAVFDRSGVLVPESRFRGKQELEDRIEIPANKTRLEGRWIFGGYYNEIYGHFILESLSRLWVCQWDALSELGVVFLPIRNYAPSLPAYTTWFFNRLGVGSTEQINPERFHVCTEPTTVEQLVVPARTFDINEGPSAGFFDTLHRTTDGLSPTGSSKLYVSRRHLKTGNHKFINEAEIERVFAKRGFDIIHPEQMHPADQLGAFANATHLAGAIGSGLHNSMFAGPGTRVLALNGRWPQVHRHRAARLGNNFPHPICPQDYLCIAAGQHLTYVEAHRSFMVDTQLPGRMPYFADAGITAANVDQWLAEETPSQQGSSRGLSTATLLTLLAELSDACFRARAIDLALDAARLYVSQGGARELLETAEQRASYFRGDKQRVAVQLFPESELATIRPILEATSREARARLDQVFAGFDRDSALGAI